MALQWRDQLGVGNDLIDADHKFLMEIVNKAEVSLKANNRVALAAVLDELSGYAKTHFELEELIARAVGYPQAGQLHISHVKLVASLNKIKEEIGEELTEHAAAQFTVLLRDWLIEHVIKEDLPMKPWIVKRSPLFDPRR